MANVDSVPAGKYGKEALTKLGVWDSVSISALNVPPVTVQTITQADGAADALVQLDAGGDTILARVTRQTVSSRALRPGVRAWAIVKAVAFDSGNVPGRTPASALALPGAQTRS